jgi:uncharacterized protein
LKSTVLFNIRIRASGLTNYLAVIFRALFLACILQAATFAVCAQALQPIPRLSSQVVDKAGLLDSGQLATIKAQLSTFEKSKGSQIVVLIVPTVKPEDISSYANRVANAWKIGRRNVGDGVLLVVASKDQEMRIEVSKILEGAIPDLAASRIITSHVTPHFKLGNYAYGITAGIDQLSARIRDEALPEASSTNMVKNTSDNSGWLQSIFIFIIAVLIFGAGIKGIFGSALGSIIVGCIAGIVVFNNSDMIILAIFAAIFAFFLTLISPFSNSGGSSSGGFSSGGGGDFGGGGASGGW